MKTGRYPKETLRVGAEAFYVLMAVSFAAGCSSTIEAGGGSGGGGQTTISGSGGGGIGATGGSGTGGGGIGAYGGSRTGGTGGGGIGAYGGSGIGGSPDTGGQTPDPSFCEDGSAVPGEIPSRQTVTFTVRNDMDENRYILTEGKALCSVYGLTRVVGEARETVPLGPQYSNWSCSNAGADGAIAFASQMAEVEPGGSRRLSWDARETVSCRSPNPECPYQLVAKGARQPSPAGDYAVALLSYPELPSWCGESTAGFVFDCNIYAAPGAATVPMGYGMCSSLLDREQGVYAPGVEAFFSLPETGDLEVVVPLDR